MHPSDTTWRYLAAFFQELCELWDVAVTECAACPAALAALCDQAAALFEAPATARIMERVGGFRAYVQDWATERLRECVAARAPTGETSRLRREYEAVPAGDVEAALAGEVAVARPSPMRGEVPQVRAAF